MPKNILAVLNQQIGQYDSKAYTAFQYALLLSLLGFFSAASSFFTIKQLFSFHDTQMFIADASAAAVSLGLLRHLVRYKNFSLVATYTIYFLFLFLLTFSIVSQNRDFGLVWSLFFPAFAILLKGVRFGLAITAVYYVILLSFAYNGIGVWEEGAWSMQAFLRLAVASFGTVFVISLAEYNRERTFKALHLLHERERRNAKKLRELSHKDHLTDLYNRRKLHEIYPQKMDIASRENSYFCFFILDVDYFKNYNDTYGHQMGDKALKKVADILKNVLRRSDDHVFRIGGEEFGGIIAGRSKESIEERLQSIQKSIRSARIEHKSSKAAAYLTASIGAVVSRPIEVCHTFESKFFQADKALYHCKENGRNSISLVAI
ncbi:GGDEF domain-containing protein [Sulfurimonas sp. HSL3-7]|uniref:GGDEF domain-containing protein n=1 Tax=Sulfonitrofixus jiaomeiensis TaxID=3131938 RepID=UPI0031F84D3B